jgi:coenzyme PQQ biosynthesis protein PqqD
LAFVLANARTIEDRDRCAAALERKCEILWSLLDAIEAAHATPAFARAAQPRLDDPEPLVVLPERAVKLTGSAREILALVDGRRTASLIAAVLHERHPEVARITDDVHDFLDEMVRLGVLERARR